VGVNGTAPPRRSRFPLFVVPLLVIAVLASMAISPQLWGAGDLFDCDLARSLEGPQQGHLFGFDLQGCDMYAQVLYGARSSLSVALLVGALTLVVGVALGSVIGFRGGWLDAVVQQASDVVLAVPLLLAAAVVMTFVDDRGVWPVSLTLVVLGWPPMTRVVRAEVRGLRQQSFAEAARALGASDRRILRRHILPNAMWPISVFAAGYTAVVVAAEAILTFLGVGLSLPAVSWGLMLARVRYRVLDHPHLLVPALFLSVTVAAFVFLGESLRNHFEPED